MSMMGDVLADVREAFGYRRESTHQERCHAYLDGRHGRRGLDETATEAAVRDMCERAYRAGRSDAGLGADDVRACLADAFAAAAQRLAEDTGEEEEGR